jgi:hypothetical protein
MFRSRLVLLLLVLIALSKPAYATGPAGLGLATDPGDALANALPEIARWFCKKAGVGYHDANRIFQAVRKKYPKGVPLTLHFRINRAQMSREDKSVGCIMGFEPWGGRVGPFEPNVLSSGKNEISAVKATGLGPPITSFPGVTLRLEPAEKRVAVGDRVYYSRLTASFVVNGRAHEVKMRPNDAIWDTSDKAAVTPIPATPPGLGLIMTPAGGAQTQGFSTHQPGRYSIIASLPSGASTYVTLEVLPGEELQAYWIVRHRDQADGCSMCLSGKFRIGFDETGNAASGRFATECTQVVCSGQGLHSLCPMPAAQKAQMSGKLLNISTDTDARIVKADMKSAAAQVHEVGSLTGDYQRIGNSRPYKYVGSGRMRLPLTQGGAVIGWAQGNWHSNTPLKCGQ